MKDLATIFVMMLVGSAIINFGTWAAPAVFTGIIILLFIWWLWMEYYLHGKD